MPMTTERRTHPFSREAPDAQFYAVSLSVDRYVQPDGAEGASSAHVWMLVSDIDVTLMSTTVFRQWLDEAFPLRPQPPVGDAPMPTIFVIPAGRPAPARPILIKRWAAITPGDGHDLYAFEGGRPAGQPFIFYPRLDT
jgi:hypothetical protein